MKQLFKYFFSFILGIIVACYIAYNTLYGSLIYSQLHSSTLFYKRLNSLNEEKLRQNLVNVLIPIEVCRANDLINKTFFIEQEYLKNEVANAFTILGISDANRKNYCTVRMESL